MSIPYSDAISGNRAREEISKVLRRFGCQEIGFSDNFEKHEVLLYFRHRGRQVQLRASAAGWAQMWLRENPWNGRRRATQQQWEQQALKQGLIAVNSILRDWCKAQITAVEAGILSFEAIFRSGAGRHHCRAAKDPVNVYDEPRDGSRCSVCK